MPPEIPPPGPPVSPIASLDDPRVLQILSTEHWSLLSSRSLAYNEALTRGGMFLSFRRALERASCSTGSPLPAG